MVEQTVRELEWIANYNDGSFLKQYDQGKENLYGNIDRDKLTRFDMIDRFTNKPIYALYMRAGQQLIFRRRTFKKIGLPDVVVFLVGYKEVFMTNNGPKTNIVINYFHPDGSIALDGERNNLELLPIEN